MGYCYVIRRVVGGPAEGGRKATRGLLAVSWLDRRKRELDFFAYLKANSGGWQTSVLQEWCGERTLTQKAYLPVDVERTAPQHYQALLERPELGQAARSLHLANSDSVFELLKALWLDAVQTGLAAEIDVVRVGRDLYRRDLLPDELASLALLLHEVDQCAARQFPGWYDTGI